MQQLQQRSYAPPPPLNAGFAYRVRDSDVNVSGGFSQGRGQLQVSAVDDDTLSAALDVPAVRSAAPLVATEGVMTFLEVVQQPCAPGFWCTAGKRIPCTVGTYNPHPNADNATACLLCPVHALSLIHI